ncbi:hypothetical protein NDN08_004395 [Rhodosorus marinus]|uniref:Uncharacterized protein ycf18 n=1 Tax=Rhodosorus marinus TaxID=101924 RepID=A0AAV8UP89_9RHOD|nr:hypothetical protein NDN08_004395 [Rhodosorus marinus]
MVSCEVCFLPFSGTFRVPIAGASVSRRTMGLNSSGKACRGLSTMFCSEEPEKEEPRPPRRDPDPDDLPEQSDPRELTTGQLFTLNSLEQSIQNMTKDECHQMTIDIIRQMMAKENFIKSMFNDDDLSFGPVDMNLDEYLDDGAKDARENR